VQVPDNIVEQSDTEKVDSNVWAFCRNAGYDAPYFWQPEREYSGAGTGAMTNLVRCGITPRLEGWLSCNEMSEGKGKGVEFFPKLSGAK